MQINFSLKQFGAKNYPRRLVNKNVLMVDVILTGVFGKASRKGKGGVPFLGTLPVHPSVRALNGSAMN